MKINISITPVVIKMEDGNIHSVEEEVSITIDATKEELEVLKEEVSDAD